MGKKKKIKIIDLLKLSTRMFRARTSRTILTILGMGVGIGAILFLVSLGYGLQKTLLEKITTSDSLLTLDVTETKAGVVNLDQATVDEIKNLSGISEISKSFSLYSQIQLDDLSTDLVAFGIEPSFLRLGGNKIEKGETLSDDDKEGVVITSSLVKLFGFEEDAIIGKEVGISFFVPEDEATKKNGLQEEMQKIGADKKYKIKGIVPGEDNIVYIHSGTLGDLEIKKYDELKIKCASPDKMNAIRDNILEKGFIVSSLSDTVDQANQIFKIVQIVLLCFGMVALVVSAIGMFNTMTITLLERTNEIGIMKSIGASDSAISIMFVMESVIMGFLGGIGGVGLGMLGGKVFNTVINILATRLGGQAVDLFYSPTWFSVLIIVFAAFVGLLTGIIPARRASKIDPLDALRYK